MRRLTLLIVVLLSSCNSQGVQELKVGTGLDGGVYHIIGETLTHAVNEGTDRHHIQLTVVSTAGSVANIEGLIKRSLDLVLTQANDRHDAEIGEGVWLGRSHKDLRGICTLHAEVVNLVVALDAGMAALGDLRGRRVAVGAPGSGTRGNAWDVFGLVGLIPDEDFEAIELSADEASVELQDGHLDAFFYTIAHPSQLLLESTQGRRAVQFLAIDGIEALHRRAPYYVEAEIPVRDYPMAKNKEKVKSLGLLSALVTRADMDNDTIYEVTRALFENLEAIKRSHPSLADLEPQRMIKDLIIPMHPGAERYYAERGWMIVPSPH